MDTDNPTGPEASVEDRLNTYFTPEAAQEEQVEAEEPQEQEVEPEEDAEEAPEEASEAEEAAEPSEPNEPNDPKHLRALVTRKTMEAATVAKAAHDRLQFAEAREQYAAQIVGDVAEVKALEAQLKQFEGIDLGQLYATDPGSALRLRDQRDDLRRTLEKKQAEIADKGKRFDSALKAHFANQWQMAIDGAKQRIGQFTPGEDMAMLKQVQELGFTEDEIKGRYADPRILHAIYKAAKWDTLQAGKSKAINTAQKAPPVVKPGASKGQGAAQADQYKKAREQFRRSGSLADGARLLMLRGIK